MEVNIRRADEADLPGVLALYSQPDMADGDEMLTPEEMAAAYRAMPEEYTLYVAEANGEVVGTFCLLILPTLAGKDSRIGLVEDVVVKRGLQGGGVGKKMMRCAMDRCREAGCYKVSLSSHISRESAHGFYRSLGFKQYGYTFHTDLPQDGERT